MTQSKYWRKVNRRKWEAVRRKALDRDGWRCRRCGKAGRLEVHHVKALRDGGAVYELQNLETLCRACHFAQNRSEGLQRAAEKYPQQAAWDRLVDEMLPDG